MDSLRFNQLKKIKIVLILTFLGFQSLSQNPFDIKSTSNKSKNPEPAKAQEKPTSPTQESIKQEIPPSKPSIIVPINQTPVSPSPASQPSSINVFDIKAGPNSKIINKADIHSTSPSEAAPPIASQIQKSDTPNQSKPKLKLNPSTTSGLQDVSIPFNVIPPKEGSYQQGTSNNTNSPPDNITTPNLSELKSNLDQFKAATLKEEGTISKNVWFVIYIFLFLLAAVAINFNRSYPMALIKATYNQNQLRILFKDAFKGNHVLIFSILYLLFIINGGIFLYQSIRIFELGQISLLLAIGLILAIYLLRHFVLFTLGLAFPLTREALLFSYTIGIHNLALGLALMLINILLSFVDPETGKMLIFSGLSIVLVMYVLRQVRGLLNNMPLILSDKFHFIIYLCTVEIAPWLLLTGILLR